MCSRKRDGTSVCVFVVVVFKIVITFARLSFDPTKRMQYLYICLLSIQENARDRTMEYTAG